MKAIVCHSFGPPEVLHFEQVAMPVPKANEVLVRIYATTVTTGDCNARDFTFIPSGLGLMARLMIGPTKPKNPILGSDLAGEIAAVGKDVRSFKVGDQVYGIDGNGGAYAEYKCMPEARALAPKPANLTYEEAAGIPFGGLTALYFLREKGHVHSGQKLLVNGASGSVGTAAVQLGKSFGAEVTGVCSTRNLDLVRSLGADTVIDYTHEDFTTGSEVYDVILDTVVRKSSFARCKKALKPGGLYLAVAGGLPEMVQSMWTSMVGNKKVVFGGGMASEKKDYLIFLTGLVEAGKLRPVVDKRYSWEQIVEAHRYVEGGHKRGNVVVTVRGEQRGESAAIALTTAMQRGAKYA